jgi:integrase
MKDAIAAPGTLRETKGGYFAQFSIGGGRRKGVTITCETEADAKRRQLAIARLVARLREAGFPAMIPNVIRDAGAADAEGLRKIAMLVDRVVAGKEPGIARQLGVRRHGTTVAELAHAWTSGELAATYPDHVKVKKSRAADAHMLDWLARVRLPNGSAFGDRPIASVTLDDCDHVMTALPKRAASPSSRRQFAQALRKLLAYAVFPLKLREALPIPTGWLPKPGSVTAKAWLYPSEDRAVMQCTTVPLVHRVLFGVLDREGLRVSEALGLTWPDVDLDRGVLRLDENKTDDPRSWALGADVARALIAWRATLGAKATKDGRVFPSALAGARWGLALKLRQALTLAGNDRAELLVKKKGRRILRAHDLRGSFVTLALAAGRTEAWVTDRTGHKSSSMVYRYKRASRTAAELELGWFAPLDEAIPELAPKPRQGANGVQTGGPGGRQGSGDGSRKAGKEARRDASGRRASVWKSCVLARVPRVRIPLSPQVITDSSRDTVTWGRGSRRG